MDSNPKHCSSRPSADNLTEDQKDPASLPTSCATSSATPPAGNEASGNRQPSTTSCGMEEMTTAGVTEAPTVRMKGGEDCVASSSSSQNMGELPGTGGSPHRSSNITMALCGSPPCVVKFSADKHVCSTTVSTPISSQLSGGSGNVGELEVEKDKSGVCNELEASPQGSKRLHDEVETENAASPAPVKQKNKKRCFKCSCKLELAQKEIGRCRCDRVFCYLHRLPELHGCDFDHKEDGRQQAREKMIKPTRHLGTSFRRLDHHSS